MKVGLQFANVANAICQKDLELVAGHDEKAPKGVANLVPTGNDLTKIIDASGVSETVLMLAMGRLSREMLSAIQANADAVAHVIGDQPDREPAQDRQTGSLSPALETELGRLYQGDCVELMRNMESDSVDMIFADPPFNLKKLYTSSIDDNLRTERYLEWCETWISECIRLLQHGGALFLWNLPRWNAELTGLLNSRMTFVH